MHPVTRSIPPLARLTVLAAMLTLGTGLLGGLHRALDHAPHGHASPHKAGVATASACHATTQGEADHDAASPAPFQNNPSRPDSDSGHCDTCHLLASWAADRPHLSSAALPPHEAALFAPLAGSPQVGGALRVDASWSLRGPPRLA